MYSYLTFKDQISGFKCGLFIFPELADNKKVPLFILGGLQVRNIYAAFFFFFGLSLFYDDLNSTASLSSRFNFRYQSRRGASMPPVSLTLYLDLYLCYCSQRMRHWGIFAKWPNQTKPGIISPTLPQNCIKD